MLPTSTTSVFLVNIEHPALFNVDYFALFSLVDVDHPAVFYLVDVHFTTFFITPVSKSLPVMKDSCNTPTLAFWKIFSLSLNRELYGRVV